MATDAEIRAAGFKYVPQQKYLQNPFELPEDQEPVTNSGIVNTNAFRNSGGGAGGALQVGDPMMNFDNYYKYTGDKYMQKQPTPLVDDLYQSKLDKTFMGFPSYKQVDPIGPFTPYSQPMNMEDPAASIENIIASRNLPLEQTMAGNIQDKIGSVTGGLQNIMGKLPTLTNILNRIGVQNFNSLSPADQLFIKTNSGYRGPTVFGENTGGGNVDPFGMNVESLMGNYAEGVRDSFDQLQNTLTKDSRAKDGVTFNKVTGEFESDTLTDEELAAYNKKTNMIRNKFIFRKKQTDQQDKDQRDIDKKAPVEANIAAAASRAESKRQYNPAVHGKNNYGLGSDGNQSYDSGQGFGTNATTGGPVSNKTGRGRTDYFYGGLASIL